VQATERIFAALLGIAMVGAVVSPIFGDPPVDGFPLSNYPMFSRPRDTENVKIAHVVAFDANGGGRPVSPGLLGSREVMQAYRTVFIAVRGGPSAAEDLCTRAATAVADAGADWSSAVRLEVRLDTFDAIKYFEGETRAKTSQTFAKCKVGSP